jgi:hypothetical protein
MQFSKHIAIKEANKSGNVGREPTLVFSAECIGFMPSKT